MIEGEELCSAHKIVIGKRERASEGDRRNNENKAHREIGRKVKKSERDEDGVIMPKGDM